MNGEILTDYNRNNFERVTILILFVPIMLLFESVVFIKIPSDSNIQINLNSVDHNADVRFSPVFQPVVVVFADFSGLISLSEDSFKEVCKTIVGCYVQLVDLFTVLFVAFLVWFFAQFANFWDWCIPHVVENPVDHVLECRVVHSSTAQQCVPWFRHRVVDLYWHFFLDFHFFACVSEEILRFSHFGVYFANDLFEFGFGNLIPIFSNIVVNLLDLIYLHLIVVRAG